MSSSSTCVRACWAACALICSSERAGKRAGRQVCMQSNLRTNTSRTRRPRPWPRREHEHKHAPVDDRPPRRQRIMATMAATRGWWAMPTSTRSNRPHHSCWSVRVADHVHRVVPASHRPRATFAEVDRSFVRQHQHRQCLWPMVGQVMSVVLSWARAVCVCMCMCACVYVHVVPSCAQLPVRVRGAASQRTTRSVCVQ